LSYLAHVILFFIITITSLNARAENSANSDVNIAYELTNPLSNLQLIDIQWNHSHGLGLNNAGKDQTLQIAPKIKIDVSENWKTLTRVYINAAKLQNINGNNSYGLGPTQFETIFTPKADLETIFGIGPYLQVPGGQSGYYGSAQWGGGLRAVFVTMPKPWTFGLFTYQSWSLGGPVGSGTKSSLGTATTNTFSFWPFISYVTPRAWVFSLDTESSYNYDVRRTYNPINATVGKVIRIGETPFEFSIGARYNVSSYPETLQYPGTPRGWGARTQITFVMGK
jgi:hypothetical protein